MVVVGHRVRLAAFFAQPHPQAAILREHMLHLHAERGADQGEAVDHEADQGAVAQARMGSHVDALQQRSRLGRLQHVLPRFRICDGPRTDAAEFTGMTWPVVADGGELLLDSRGGYGACLLLDPGGKVEGLDGGIDRTP